MSSQQAFLDEVETYLAEAACAATTFGEKAVGDPKFVFELRTGRSPKLPMVDRVRKFMTDNPPSNGTSDPPAGAEAEPEEKVAAE
jgi:hypothetical protein